MPSYVTMSDGARVRVLRVVGDQANPVTSLPDQPTATEVAALLSRFGTNLPDFVEGELDRAGLPYPAPEFTTNLSADGHEWAALEASTDPFDAARHVLASAEAYISAALASCPPAARRAVREELAQLLHPYDGVPVFALAYDCKYAETAFLFLITAALGAADDKQLAQTAATGDATWALDWLAEREDLVVPGTVQNTDERGHLRVLVHPAQLQAWLAVNRPDILAP